MPNNTVLETRNLTKIFKDFWRRDKVCALNNINLQVEEGTVFGLLGPNGSGKSTFVKLALGLLHTTQGHIAVFGRPAGTLKDKGRIGFMPEETYLYQYLDAEATLDFYGSLNNLSSKERKKRAQALISMVGLTPNRRRPLKEYSKGMARRIGLAQALIGDPELLFLDEPTSGLDPIGTREIKDLILELKKRGKTIFLCSHLLADVEDVCDKIAVLYNGRICTQGSVSELLSKTDTTQITSAQLSDESIKKIAQIIEQDTQDQPDITNPMERLESFFLQVIKKARQEKEQSSGAEAGTSAPEFLGKEKIAAKRKKILDDLEYRKE
ncbi:MAG: ABC transporter ATP-binding protein [Candidatus Omnitrophica bacterium]|nr:ABC transporter ATP-binding protein [Candidatus Omnitrophota bacterium]